MSQLDDEPSGLAGVLGAQDGVIDTTSALGWMSREELRWRVTSGRWQRRHRLPEPDRQSQRRDPAGRRRWLDAVWDDARLVVEVDGIHHLDAMQYWADMDRDNDVTLGGYRVLRFPAFVVRYHPGDVAGKIREALRQGCGAIEIRA